MAQRRFAVGTTPIIIGNVNSKRKYWDILFLASAIEPGNVGRVHIGKGFPPSATLGDPNQGDVLLAGDGITDKESYANDPSVFKGQWWAVASQADQIIVVDEVSAD